MTNVAFFIDTADIDYINRLWDKLGKYVEPSSIVGITTNPNAMAKVKCDTLSQFEELVPKLCQTVATMRGDSSLGLVYVQTPNSLMTEESVVKWAEYVNGFNGNGCAIGLKIPPFTYSLRMTQHPALKKLYLNVTGLADAGTAITSLSYGDVFFASIIPGRMEEVKIDANEHMRYLAEVQFYKHQNIIAGSMRTMEGLKNSIYYQTVPTIGTRVWDIIDSENRWEEFVSYWDTLYEVSDEPVRQYLPVNTTRNQTLSNDFFTQMDSLGEPMFNEFISK